MWIKLRISLCVQTSGMGDITFDWGGIATILNGFGVPLDSVWGQLHILADEQMKLYQEASDLDEMAGKK